MYRLVKVAMVVRRLGGSPWLNPIPDLDYHGASVFGRGRNPGGLRSMAWDWVTSLALALGVAGAVLTASPGAHAEFEAPAERPIYVNQIEKYSFKFGGKTTAPTGTFYVLDRESLAGKQRVQIAFDKQQTPRIFRFIQTLGGNKTLNAVGLAQSVIALAPEIRYGWKNYEKPIRDNVNAVMAAYAEKPRDLTRRFEIGSGVVATLRTKAAARIAALDIPILYPPTARPAPDALRALLSDTATLAIDQGGKRTDAYHAPNGRYVARKQIEVEINPDAVDENGEPIPDDEIETEIVEILVTGSWRVAADGRYCLEEAPEPGWDCVDLFQRDGKLVILEKRDDQVNTTPIAQIVSAKGNPRALPVLRVTDVLDAARARKQVTRKSEYRRPSAAVQQVGGQTVGAPPVKLFFAGNGNYAGRTTDGETVIGRWHVLEDGRRCLRQGFPEELDWTCHFLRKRADGTVQMVSDEGEVIATLSYKLGNPENL